MCNSSIISSNQSLRRSPARNNMEAWETMRLPLLACLLLPALLVYLGLHIVRRGIIFVDLALAQVAALGTSWCVMLGHNPHDIHTYWWSIAFTLGGALIFTF